MSYVNAFWVGGLICALVQILMEKTKLMPGRIMVILVCLGALLGALGVYEPFQEFAGAGAGVPTKCPPIHTSRRRGDECAYGEQPL